MRLTLRTLRALKDLTQKEAADLIGVDEQTWANYEKGKTFPDVPKIIRIEKAFNVNYNDIIFLPSNYGLTVKISEHDSNKQNING